MNGLTYLFQVNLYLILFYLLYYVLLKNETYFKLNRFYLVSSAFIAFLIPVLHSEWIRAMFVTQPIAVAAQGVTAIIVVAQTPEAETSISLTEVLSAIYWLGTITLSLRFLWQLLNLRRLLKSEPASKAFSFFNIIKIDPGFAGHETIQKHEQVHVRQWHSADTVFFELLTIINWFNPVSYLYKQTIKDIHEFIADENVVREEGNKKEYALLLLSNTLGIKPHQLTNSFFNQSLLKRRIYMLHKTKSPRTALLKYGLAVPLLMVMLIFSSAAISNPNGFSELKEKLSGNQNVVIEKAEIASKKTYITLEKHSELQHEKKLSPKQTQNQSLQTPSDTTHNFSSIDSLPSFPGGQQAWAEYLAKNLKYPETAREKKAEGRVVIQFTVEKNGKLEDAKVLKGLGYGLDEEAVRVLLNSPDWKPGIKDGQPVRVSFVMPVVFALSANTGQTKKPFIIYPPENPIFILDGKEIEENEFRNLDQHTIERIEVIKGEAAAAKYGEKAEKGVVIVTTKKQ